jgi:hypothetical protein
MSLSECLNVINCYKTAAQRKVLLSAQDPDKTLDTSTLSSSELPSFEVAAALHILAAVGTSKMSLKMKVLADVMSSALRVFYKTVLNNYCPYNIKKAYANLVLNLLDTDRPINNSVKESGIETDLLETIKVFLARFTGNMAVDCKIFLN